MRLLSKLLFRKKIFLGKLFALSFWSALVLLSLKIFKVCLTLAKISNQLSLYHNQPNPMQLYTIILQNKKEQQSKRPFRFIPLSKLKKYFELRDDIDHEKLLTNVNNQLSLFVNHFISFQGKVDRSHFLQLSEELRRN